jgi:hypothetical protein
MSGGVFVYVLPYVEPNTQHEKANKDRHDPFSSTPTIVPALDWVTAFWARGSVATHLSRARFTFDEVCHVYSGVILRSIRHHTPNVGPPT